MAELAERLVLILAHRQPRDQREVELGEEAAALDRLVGALREPVQLEGAVPEQPDLRDAEALVDVQLVEDRISCG